VGRLQRKKTTKKKKKTDAATGAPAPAKKDAAVKLVAETDKRNLKTKATAPKKPVSVAKTTAAKPRDNLISKSIQFLREVKVELKKVAWPSRKQTIGSTIVVLVLVAIIAFFLGAVDIGLSSLVKVVLQ
jgi:preprotein translocase subunit SecE